MIISQNIYGDFTRKIYYNLCSRVNYILHYVFTDARLEYIRCMIICLKTLHFLLSPFVQFLRVSFRKYQFRDGYIQMQQATITQKC